MTLRILPLLFLMISGSALAGGVISGGPTSKENPIRVPLKEFKIVKPGEEVEVERKVFERVANAIRRHRAEIYVNKKIGPITPTDLDWNTRTITGLRTNNVTIEIREAD